MRNFRLFLVLFIGGIVAASFGTGAMNPKQAINRRSAQPTVAISTMSSMSHHTSTPAHAEATITSEATHEPTAVALASTATAAPTIAPTSKPTDLPQADYSDLVAAFVGDAAPEVKAAYAYAVANPDELKKYPCYCGCVAFGHVDNLTCYVKGTEADGTPILDNHAIACGVCIDITMDVIRLKGQGKSSRQVRAYIDAVYSLVGPSTNTAWPND